MEKTDPVTCVLCGDPVVCAPRIFIRQEHDLAAPVGHALALCHRHGEELRDGAITPQNIIYTWATHAHDDLYRNERLVLHPELRCLSCNAELCAATAATADEMRCPKCGVLNEIGSALGHRVAVRLLVRAT
jgi:phage FluMu protein Com